MPDPYELARSYRLALLRRDRAAVNALVTAYGKVYRSLKDDIEKAIAKALVAQAAGDVVNDGWAVARLQGLLSQVETEVEKFSAFAVKRITAEQAHVVTLAVTHAESLMGAVIDAAFNRLPVEALNAFIGFASDGSPLSDLLAKLGTEAANAVKDALLNGIAQGDGVKTIARQIKSSLGGNQARALVIARNETLRAYRAATSETYRANSDILSGWVWLSAADSRTCPVCWAMHGTEHGIDETLDSHIACRCVAVPRVKGVSASIPSGSDLFAALDESAQREILGPGRFQRYSDGLSLSDMVGVRDDARWGRERFLRPVGR